MFKIGQKVWDLSVQEEPGGVVSINDGIQYPLIVEFKYRIMRYNKNLENIYGQKTLSATPYTFEGFSQDPVIESGALVYVRSMNTHNWEIRYYSHFEAGLYKCFNNQKKEGASFPWTFCQTENPLI